MTASPLPERLAEQLALVPATVDHGLHYAPCSVTLHTGEILPRVYIVAEDPFLRYWGLDPARPTVDVDSIAAIEESPHRLPAALAAELYAAGESGMGYCLFTVDFADGSSLPFVTGNAVDFPNWPPGVDPRDAVAVRPHEGREHFRDRPPGRFEQSAPYSWCTYRP